MRYLQRFYTKNPSQILALRIFNSKHITKEEKELWEFEIVTAEYESTG